MLGGQAALGDRLCASSSPSWPFCSGACRPASCPTRTPARSSPWSPRPSGATLPRTDEALDYARHYFDKNEGKNVEGVFTVGGFSFAGQGQNAGIAFVPLKPWDERRRQGEHVQGRSPRARPAPCPHYHDALIISFIPPAALELGNATGFDLQLVDTGNVGHAKLVEARNMLLGMAMQDKRIVGVRPVSLEDAPQLNVDVDQDKARALGLDIGQINQTISSAWGGSYVNDFIDRGRVKRVYIQADRALSPAARGHFRPLRPRRRRQEHGAVHRFLDAQMGQRAGPAVALQRPARRSSFRARRRRA